MKGSIRFIAFALCLVAAATLGLCSIQIAYPLAFAIAATIAFTERFPLRISKTTENRLAMGVAIVFILRWAILDAPSLGATRVRLVAIGMLDYAQAYPIAQALLLWMVLQLFIRRGNAFPATFPLYPALVIILAGTMPTRVLGEWRNYSFQTASLVAAFLIGLYFLLHDPPRTDAQSPASRARRNAYVALFAFILFCGWGAGALVYKHGTDLDLLVAGMLQPPYMPSTAGFSNSGRLGRLSSRKGINENAITLHIASNDAPGYLRGKAFDQFAGREWTTAASPVNEKPVDDLPNDSNMHWYSLQPGSADLEADPMSIEASTTLKGTVFTCLETARIAAPDTVLTIDAHAIVAPAQLPSETPYRITGIARPNAPLTESERKALTAISETLDPRIPTLAQDITRNCKNDIEKLNAVTSYLRNTCTYSLDVSFDIADDPIAMFLFEAHKGHCEYFATAAALLLRCAGVPCRYVTGFVSGERNEYGNYWVARNKDAHAWVEAYIEGQGWRTIEATPSTGVPQGERPRTAQLWEYIVHRAKTAIAAIRNMGWRELGDLAVAAMMRIWPFMLIVVTAIAAIFVIRRWLQNRQRHRATLGNDPTAVSLHRKLRVMDRRAAKLGYVRDTHETINHFADRIDRDNQSQLALWYRTYALARYANDQSAISNLTTLAS